MAVAVVLPVAAVVLVVVEVGFCTLGLEVVVMPVVESELVVDVCDFTSLTRFLGVGGWHWIVLRSLAEADRLIR